jgi:DNA modification methylase
LYGIDLLTRYKNRLIDLRGTGNTFSFSLKCQTVIISLRPQTSEVQYLLFHIGPKFGEFSSGFPEGLIQLAIDTAVPKNGTVLDPFCDSGTTGVVALKNKRNFIGIEIVENKIEKIEKRLADTTRHALP